MRENLNNKGVTLIEILIGIIITSIMVGAMYTSYNVVSGAYKQVSDKAKLVHQVELVQMIMGILEWLDLNITLARTQKNNFV